MFKLKANFDDEELEFDDVGFGSPSLNFYKGGRFYIGGAFDGSIQTNIVPYLFDDIAKKQGLIEAKIQFIINSPGGATHVLKDLLSLIDIAKGSGIIVETLVFGNAHSCGSMLAVSGTKGFRMVGRHAEHLCHLGAAGNVSKNEEDLKRFTARAKTHFDFIKSIYKDNCNIPNLDEVIHNDNFFVRGRNLVKFGLADRIIG